MKNCKIIIDFQNLQADIIKLENTPPKKNTYIYIDITKKQIDFNQATYLNFIFFLQKNHNALNKIDKELYNHIMKIIKSNNRKQLIKKTSIYIARFFNQNNEYIKDFYNCIDILKKSKHIY